MTSTPTPRPIDWHRRPKNFEGPCPICLCPGKSPGEHRAVAPEENQTAKWFKRRKLAYGWRYKSIFTGQPKERQRGPTPRTKERIVQATSMLAVGATYKEVASKLAISTSKLHDTQKNHREIWNICRQEAESDMMQLVDRVRTEAGTNAVLADPDAYITRAQAADKWIGELGGVLFPAKDEGVTLCSFFESHYMPLRLADASPGTVYNFTSTLERWRLVTGDPPLAEITKHMLAKFRDFLAKSRGRGAHERASPNTVNFRLRTLQAVLDFAGPPAPHRRDCVGLIQQPPWIRRPQLEMRIPRIVSSEAMEAVYLAAPRMKEPKIDGFEPSAWWQALIVLCYSTGLRAGTLFSLRMEWINWADRKIVIPPQAMKSKRPHIAHLNETTLEHLGAIRSDRELVFPWPRHRRTFWLRFHKLQNFAGIPHKEQFGLRELRKTHATLLWGNSPEAAQLSLGHTGMEVTIGHYVQSGVIVSAAVDRMPMPAVFKNGGGNGAGPPPDRSRGQRRRMNAE